MSNLNLTELEIRDLLNRYHSELRKLQFQIERTQNTLKDLSSQLGESSPTPPIQYTATEAAPPVKRRGPGRPPKSETTAETEGKKRGPGRPPKKRGPGRPPKKRGPGRPPKSETTGETETEGTKRGPGRPPKKRGPGRPPKKRGPGRPPKSETTGETESTKKGPGRPPKKRGPGRPPKSESGQKTLGGYTLSDWDQFLISTIKEEEKPLITKEIVKKADESDLAKDLSKAEIKQYISRSIHKLANKHETLKKVPYEGRGYAYATEDMVFSNGKVKKEYSR